MLAGENESSLLGASDRINKQASSTGFVGWSMYSTTNRGFPTLNCGGRVCCLVDAERENRR